MIFLALPSTVFWILIYFGNAYHHLLLARFFTGWTGDFNEIYPNSTHKKWAQICLLFPGGGIQTTIMLYISEISNNKLVTLKLIFILTSFFWTYFEIASFLSNCTFIHSIRGRLGSIMQLSRNTGILIAYILGAIVDYKSIPCIFIFIPLIYVVCFVFLPNTPQYYLQSNQVQVRKQQNFHSFSIRILVLWSLICFNFL